MVLSAAAAVFCGCRATPSGGLLRNEASLPGLDLDELLAESIGAQSLEMRELERRLSSRARLPRDTEWAIRLRLAVLALRLGNVGAATSHVASVLEGVPVPTPHAESLACYIEHEVLLARADRAGALAALDRARRLAAPPDLRERIAAARTSLAPAPVASGARPARAALGPVTVVRRAEWGGQAANPKAMDAMGRPGRITVHHSALFAEASSAAARKIVKSFQRYHMNEKGWGDIGYHFLIDRAGVVLEGRELAWQGAHAGNGTTNKANIGICLLGNFEPRTRERVQRPTDEQLHALELLVRALSDLYEIPGSQLLTHAEIHPGGPAATECPGDYLAPFVVDLRNRIRTENARVTARE